MDCSYPITTMKACSASVYWRINQIAGCFSLSTPLAPSGHQLKWVILSICCYPNRGLQACSAQSVVNQPTGSYLHSIPSGSVLSDHKSQQTILLVCYYPGTGSASIYWKVHQPTANLNSKISFMARYLETCVGRHAFKVVKNRFDFIGFPKQTQPTNCEIIFAICHRNI